MEKQELTVTLQDYEALTFLAREGARLREFIQAAEADPSLRHLLNAAARFSGMTTEGARSLEAFLRSIEVKNGIVRYLLIVRWQEVDEPLPPRVAGAATRFPENWPPNLEAPIEMFRPISLVDVKKVLSTNARRPVNVMVTIDPGRRVGWTPVEDYFR